MVNFYGIEGVLKLLWIYSIEKEFCMPMVKLSDAIVSDARIRSRALNRSVAGQADRILGKNWKNSRRKSRSHL